MSGLGLEVAHELIQAFLMLRLTEAGQVGVEGSHLGIGMAEIDLELTEVLAALKKMGGVRMS